MNFHYLFSILLLASCFQIDAMRVAGKLAKRCIPLVANREIKSDASQSKSYSEFVHDEFEALGFSHMCQRDPRYPISCAYGWPSQELLKINPALLLQDIERWAEAANHSVACLEERLK